MAGSRPHVVFLEPRSPDSHVFSKTPLPRLGSVLLATILRDRGWEATVFLEEAADIDFSIVLNADFVGISTITSTAPRAYALADEIRMSGIPVVMGGPHVTFLPDEGLEHADIVVRGEGEETIVALAEYFQGRLTLEQIQGLSYRDGDRICHNPPAPLLKDLNRLPFPDLSLIHGFGVRGFSGRRVIPVQTSRGCPFNCSFCSVTEMFGHRLRKREPRSVLDELERYKGIRAHIFFYDDHFAADRNHAGSIAQGILDRGLNFTWSAQVRTDIARDPGLLDLMSRAGCNTLFIGFESVNPDALREINKTQSLVEMTQATRIIRKAGIDLHGMFIYGLDSDNRASLRSTLRFAKRMHIATAQFLLLTPIPGTLLFAKLQEENRLLFSDWSLYDGHHVVFTPKNLAARDLQRAQVKAHRKFYSNLRNMGNLVRLKLWRAAVFSHARKVLNIWKRRNRFFMKILKLHSRSDRFSLRVDLKLRFPDIKAAAASARRHLSTVMNQEAHGMDDGMLP